MRKFFDQQLDELHQELITLGAYCESAIATAAKAFLENDPVLARQLPELAGEIARRERDTEALCLRLLLRRQPVAGDLRDISAALKMLTDMERIGHQSADIGEIVARQRSDDARRSSCIRDMAETTIRMVTESIDAFVRQDPAAARRVLAMDDRVDESFDQTKQLLIHRIRSCSADPEAALDLLMIAKYFERIGDHAVNIARWALFSVTGTKEGEKA